MEKSTTSIYNKLLFVQRGVRVLEKDATTKTDSNKKGYDFLSKDKILSVLRPLMDKAGLILKTEVLSITNTRYEYKDAFKNDKLEILSNVELLFTWIDGETGEIDQIKFGANGINGLKNGVGDAITYAKRHFLIHYFNIRSGKDDFDEVDEDFNGDDEPIVIDPKSKEPSRPIPQKNEPKSTKEMPLAGESKIELLPTMTEKWNEAVRYMQGDGTIAKIRKKYILSDQNADMLEKAALHAVA